MFPEEERCHCLFTIKITWKFYKDSDC
jgi:hypothetical protein